MSGGQRVERIERGSRMERRSPTQSESRAGRGSRAGKADLPLRGRPWRRGVAFFAAVPLAVSVTVATPDPLAAQVGDPRVVSGEILHLEAPRVPGVARPAGPVMDEGEIWPTGAPLGLPLGALQQDDHPDVLVLLGLFSDSPEPPYSADDINAQLFDETSGPAVFTRYWREVSQGRIAPTGVATPWIRTDVTLFEAAGMQNGHGFLGERMREYMAQVVERSDPLVDYGRFDNDGPDGVPNSGDDDGFIDNLVIQYLEVAGSCMGPSIWPHFSALSEGEGDDRVQGIPTDDLGPDGTPIRAFIYLTESATQCDGETIQRGNVIAHEFGHRLGLPDLYRIVEDIRPQGRVWGTGCFEIMSGGAWGCGQGPQASHFGPVHLSPLNRSRLGWTNLTQIDTVRGETFTLSPVQTGGGILHIRLTREGEALWIEFRPRTGFDGDLPAGGVLVYHQDFGLPRDLDYGTPERTPYPYYVVEADGDHEMTRLEKFGGNRGEAEDVFSPNGEQVRWVTSLSHPGIAAHSGEGAVVTFHSIQVVGGRAIVRLSTAPTPTLAVPAETRTVEADLDSRFEIQGGVPPYRAEPVQGGRSQFVSTSVERDELVVRADVIPPVVEVGIPLRITDARGQAAEVTLRVSRPNPLRLDQLLAVLLEPESEPLSGEVIPVLDGFGNGNGQFDVGDFRALGIGHARDGG